MPLTPPSRSSLAISVGAMLASFVVARFLPSRSASHETLQSPGLVATGGISPVATAPIEPRNSNPSASFLGDLDADADPDFFREAGKLFTAIEQLTAADLATITTRGRLPEGITRARYFGEAIATAFVERWFAIDPEHALVALIHLTGPDAQDTRREGDDVIRNALAQNQPLAFLQVEKNLDVKKLGIGDRKEIYPWPWEKAYSALARRNLEAARRLAAEGPEGRREDAKVAIGTGLAAVDPVAAMRLVEIKDGYLAMGQTEIAAAALRHAERAGLGVVRQVLEAGGTEALDESTAIRWRIQFPDLEIELPGHLRLSSLPSSLGEDSPPERTPLSATEAQARLANWERLPRRIQGEVVTQLVGDWALTEPAAAVDWAYSHQTDSSRALCTAFEYWQSADESAALGWLSRLPPSQQKSELANQAAMELADRGELTRALELRTGPDLTLLHDASAIEFLAILATRRDPAEAVRWLAQLDNVSQNTKLLRQAIGHWLEADADSAGAWLEDLAPGELRDTAALAFAETAATQDLPAATEWLEEIQSPEQRAAAATAIYRRHAQEHPAAARAWLRTRPELDEPKRERLIRDPE